MYKHAIEVITLVSNILCWTHYYLYCGRDLRRPLLFFSGAIWVGALAEAAAVLITGSYSYPGFWLYIGPVPLFIAVGWGSNFYYPFWITRAVVRGPKTARWYMPLFALAAGAVCTVTDLWYDPVAVVLDWWEWEHGSAYFGVPIANFVGWFFFAAGFSWAYLWVESKAWSTVKRFAIFYPLLVGVFAVTAAASFPFLMKR